MTMALNEILSISFFFFLIFFSRKKCKRMNVHDNNYNVISLFFFLGSKIVGSSITCQLQDYYWNQKDLHISKRNPNYCP